jgi:rare lipoprotein A
MFMPRAIKILICAGISLFTANCTSSSKLSSASNVDPKYGVKTSPRLVEEGQSVPKGGGRQMVGKPYKIAGRTYVPNENPNYTREGTASWYGPSFHGRMTANGEIFDKYSVSAAHTTMPLPSYARVTNLSNNRSIIVRVNDRGPYHGNRVIDVSQRVAESLEFKHLGTAKVRVDYVGRASTTGSDDKQLMATLSTDGTPARMPGSSPRIMLASASAPIIPFAAAEKTVSSSLEQTSVHEDHPAAEVVGSPASSASVPAAAAVQNMPSQMMAFAPLPPERPLASYDKSSEVESVSTEDIPAIPMPPMRPLAEMDLKNKADSVL